MGSLRQLTLDQIAWRPEPGMDAPGAAQFVPGGGAITYLYSAEASLVRSLWHHDLLTGQRSVLAGPLDQTTREETLSRQEQLARERTRTSELGVTSYAWATASAVPTLLVPIAGRIFIAVDAATTTGVRQIPGIEHADGPLLSPDGTLVSYAQDGDLYVARVAGGSPHRLTDDAGQGLFNGLAEFVAAEELGRFEGAWWSADSGAIAYAHVDEGGVPPISIARTDGSGPEFHHYPFAGGPNARVRLRVAKIDSSVSRDVGLGMAPDDYLARVLQHPNGGWLAAVLPRDQHTLVWHRVGTDGSAERLWVEESEPWLNLDDDTRVLPDGRILRSSERSGFRHLELRTSRGELQRVLTAGEWLVTGVVALAPARGEVLFMGTRDGVTERHLYAVSLDAPAPVIDPERLTDKPGWHAVVASSDGERWVDTWSDLEHSPSVLVAGRDLAKTLIHASSLTAAEAGFDPPELVELLAADGETTLHGAVYRAGRDPAADGAHRGVVWVYGGPHSQFVKRSWEMTVHGLRQHLAAAGATLVVVDNRGTYFRGKAFEAPIESRLGWIEVADQAAAVRQLAARGVLAAGGVGAVGGSYGGFMVILAMALEPELFTVGVAIAPVTEWTAYDTAYTERYLGTPAANAAAYRSSSALSHAAAVRGDLLVIHGTADENVHLRHSQRLVEALRGAGHPVELVELPEQRHRTRGGAIRVREERTVAHLLRGLSLPLPEEPA